MGLDIKLQRRAVLIQPQVGSIVVIDHGTEVISDHHLIV